MTREPMSFPYHNNSDGHVDGAVSQLHSNRLLSTLPQSELKRLEPHFTPIDFEEGQILLEPGQALQLIYFPACGLVSLSLDGRGRGTTNVGVVGRDGMIGTVSASGTNPVFSRAKVEIAGDGVGIPVQQLRDEFAQGGELQNLMLRYLQSQSVEASQTAFCARTHLLDQRLSSWILRIHDEVPQSTISLSLCFFAQLLAATYSETILAAASLWQRGLIRFCHEHLTVLDRAGLEAVSCSCYGILRHELETARGYSQLD